MIVEILSGALTAILLVWIIWLVRPRREFVRLVIASVIYKHLKFEGIIMATQLNLEELLTGTLGIINHATQAPIDASFANVVADNGGGGVLGDAPFTVVVNTDNSLTVDGIAEGAGTLTVSADCTYTDPVLLVTVSVTKTVVIAVTVSPASTATDLVVTFGAPVPQPAA